MPNNATLPGRIVGSLLAGACGDALGAPVEFRSLAEIHQDFGSSGIRKFSEVYGEVGTITDDTQLTLYTAEGLVEAFRDERNASDETIIRSVHEAYYRWRSTPRRSKNIPDPYRNHPGLIQEPALKGSLSPGSTCMNSLANRRELGTFAVNDSKGNGGIMRIAPVGLVFRNDPERAFRLGCDVARLTHGHPTGYIAAGVFAMIIAKVLNGQSLDLSIETTLSFLVGIPDHEEISQAIIHARFPEPNPSPRASFTGFGWVAEEALAIALHSVASTKSLEDAVIQAVNHDGDSDTTGSLAGQLAGAIYGVEAIPKRWVERLLTREIVEGISERLEAIVV